MVLYKTVHAGTGADAHIVMPAPGNAVLHADVPPHRRNDPRVCPASHAMQRLAGAPRPMASEPDLPLLQQTYGWNWSQGTNTTPGPPPAFPSQSAISSERSKTSHTQLQHTRDRRESTPAGDSPSSPPSSACCRHGSIRQSFPQPAAGDASTRQRSSAKVLNNAAADTAAAPMMAEPGPRFTAPSPGLRGKRHAHSWWYGPLTPWSRARSRGSTAPTPCRG